MSIVPDVVDAQLRLQFLGRDVMLPSVMASDPAHDPKPNYRGRSQMRRSESLLVVDGRASTEETPAPHGVARTNSDRGYYSVNTMRLGTLRVGS